MGEKTGRLRGVTNARDMTFIPSYGSEAINPHSFHMLSSSLSTTLTNLSEPRPRNMP